MTGGEGITFPDDGTGRRSTSAVGRAVVAAALRGADPAGARAAEQETAWRARYPGHFRRLVEVGLVSPRAWVDVAAAGLEAATGRMVTAGPGGDRPVGELLTDPAETGLHTVDVRGTGEPERELVLPYRGQRLRGDAVRSLLDDWVGRGVVEPSVATAVGAVLDEPEQLALAGRTVAVLGAGAEMSPAPALLRWGATVAALDLPRPPLWERVLRTARASGGRLLAPAARPDGDAAQRAGADLLTQVPATADWLLGLDGGLVLGNYLYADGGPHVRVTVAADLLARRLQRERPDVALAFLATPTDVFAVPADAVRHATGAYAARSPAAKLLGRPLRTASRGRLLRRAYRPDADPAICDCLVPQQGPNYALAKRIQRWRATVARDAGTTVSFHVAPSSRTRSVLTNRALAAAFAGAHRFGVEVFEPQTASTLMAALLAHDLHTAPPRHEHPWQDEAHAAAHGGLWRTAYAPRSVLGLAALLGYASSRS